MLALVVGFAPRAGAADPKEWGDESAAEDEKQEKPAPAEAAPKEGEATADAPVSAPAAPPDETPAAEPEAGSGAKSNFLLGLRYRGLFLPKTVLDWFIEGGQSVYVNGIGPELAIHKPDAEYVFSAWLALYNMDPVAIKSSSDAEEAWEIVDSKMKSLYFTFDYLWHHPFSRTLELSYGGSAGLGILFGDLHRTQATLVTGGTPGNADDYVPCDGVNQPPQGSYCDDINNHYHGYSEPNWFHGGAKPVLFPWITGQVGLRYQPSPKFVARLDVGLGTSGLYFGVGADYGL